MKSGRELLSFHVVGMAAREAMLLKSFVRMLDGRTKQRWLFKPQQDGEEQQAADLIFLGDEGTEPDLLASDAQAPRQLRMGVLALDLFARLDRPLRPDDLERELNRMGTQMVTARAADKYGETANPYVSTLSRENVGDGLPSPLWRPVAVGSAHSEFAPTTVFSNEFAGTVPATLLEKVSLAAAPPANTPEDMRAKSMPPAPSTPPPAKLLVAPNDRFRMLRWPHANLLGTPARLKLAAFMVGSSTTLSNLQNTSGQTHQACAEFLQDLHASGFLFVLPAGENTSGGAAGLQAGGAVPKAVEVAVAQSLAELPVKPPHNVLALPSLFDRIRARLGISLAG